MSIFWLWRKDLRFRNKTRYQRLLHIAREFDVILVVSRSAHIADEISETVQELVRCPWSGRGMFGHSILALYGLLAFWQRRRHIQAVYSPPDYTIFMYALIKLFWPRIHWIADMWDDPNLSPYMLSIGNPIRKAASRLYNWFMQRVLRYADLVITTGQDLNSHIAEVMVQEFEILPSRLQLVTNGVDLDMFKPQDAPPITNSQETEFRLIYVGYLLEYMGVGILLDAIKSLVERIPSIKLILVGFTTQAHRDWATQAIASRNLEHYVDFRGTLPAEQIPPTIGSCHICVCPFPSNRHLDRAFPIKIYEYLAMGKPVIATALPGLRSLVFDNYNGLIVAPEDVQDLANAILKLYQDQDLYQRLAGNARPSVEQYDWSTVNRPVIQRLSSLISKKQGLGT